MPDERRKSLEAAGPRRRGRGGARDHAALQSGKAGLPGGGSGGRPGGADPHRRGATRPRAAGLDAAGHVGHRGMPPNPPAARDPRPAGNHGDGADRGSGRGARLNTRRRRLHHQAVQHGGAARPDARAAPPVQRCPGQGPARPSTTSRWISPRTGCSATAGRSISARPNSGCWSSSCSIPAACSRARSC